MTKLNQIPSPFLFAPLAEKIHYPAWQKASQDMPIENSISGTMEIELQNHSPLLIGDEHPDNEINFFTLPDGRPAIPGSSIRGMVRGIIETITQGRLEQIEDQKLSYRDLRNSDYRNVLTTTKENAYKAMAQTGWLKFEHGKWKLYPCQHYRIENHEIEKTFRITITTKEREAEKIYKKLSGIKTVWFQPNPEQAHQHSKDKLYYAKATQLSKLKADHLNQGYLIVTGQTEKKHMNFIFTKPQPQAIDFASDQVMPNFLRIANSKNSQNKSDIFNYLKEQKHPHGIPVFYLANKESQAEHIGLAQMFRLSYKHSLAELRPAAHKENNSKKDFASLLFGQIENDDQDACRHRVNFGLFRLSPGQTEDCEKNIQMVLASPKPSFYPSYLKQKIGEYQTYNNKEAKLAGRKYYLPQENTQDAIIPKGAKSDKIVIYINPIKKGHKFSGKCRFHNINPVELGALIFALELGEEPENSNYFHTLGMAKPYGYGKVQFQVNSIQLASGTISKQEALAAFYAYCDMYRFWNPLKQIRALHTYQPLSLRYPKMSMSKDNEFNIIKDSKGSIKLPDLLQFPQNKSQWQTKIKQRYQQQIEQWKKLLLQQQEEHEKQQKEQLIKQKQEQEKQKQLAEQLKKQQQEAERKANRTQLEILLEDILKIGAEGIMKPHLQQLADNNALYQQLSQEEKQNLVDKIIISNLYKNSNTKTRKKWRQKLPGLL